MNLGDATLKPLRVLGAGSFGRIFLCLQAEGRQQRKVCVKRIIVRNTKNDLALIKEEVRRRRSSQDCGITTNLACNRSIFFHS